MSYISEETQDHFEMVIDDDVIYNLPNSPDRWPDEFNGGDECKNPPPTKRVRTDRVFIATQSTITSYTVGWYVEDLKNGCSFPPIAAIKTKKGIIVWNGHHRLVAHRLAGRKTIKVRFWAEIDDSVIEGELQ